MLTISKRPESQLFIIFLSLTLSLPLLYELLPTDLDPVTQKHRDTYTHVRTNTYIRGPYRGYSVPLRCKVAPASTRATT